MNIYLDRIQEAITAATRGLDVAQLTRHRGGKWSVADILEHLDRTYQTTIPHLQKCLDAGKPTAGRASLVNRLAVGLVVGLGYMPSGRKAPAYAVPKGLPPEEILSQIPLHLAKMDRVLAECERRFGADHKLADHFVLGPMSAQQWRKFHWVHTRHHMRQIARMQWD